MSGRNLMERQLRSDKRTTDDSAMAIHAQVIDSAHGGPAVGVGTRLTLCVDGGWSNEVRGSTGADGRVVDWSPPQRRRPARGLYRLLFDAGHYFAALGIATLYPEVTIVFAVSDPDDDCHLTLLLGPHSYTAFHSNR
jgi:5-hydroxyisourate hydrolase